MKSSADVRKKILIADDVPASRELIGTILDEAGYNVIEASNGTEALNKARELTPDLILLDLHMPLMDGYGVVSALRADPRFSMTPVVALTASAMQGDRERALSAGFTAYIAKPIRVADLRAEVARLVR